MKKILFIVLFTLLSLSFVSCKSNKTSDSDSYPVVIYDNSYDSFKANYSGEGKEYFVSALNVEQFFESFPKKSIFYEESENITYHLAGSNHDMDPVVEITFRSDRMDFKLIIYEKLRKEKASYSSDMTYNGNPIYKESFSMDEGLDYMISRNYNNSQYSFTLFFTIRGYKEAIDYDSEEELRNEVNEFKFQNESGIEAFLAYMFSSFEEMSY